MRRYDAARDSDGTAAAPSPLDVRSTPGTVFRGICARQNPARCYVRQRESINALSGVFYLQVTADIRRHLFVSQELPGKTMVRLPKPLREKEFRMSLSKNAKSRIVTVAAPLFLGFVMPWFLQANRGIRGEAQFKLDPSAMLASTVAEVLAAIAFVVVFIASLLYFAKQSDARKLLLLAGVVSLIAFIAFTLTYSLYIHGSVYGWIYYALFQMFPGLILVVGYITAAIAAPLIKPSSRN